jgi:two-component system, cell cycle sensor histidine kinase and response regulator CckA
MTSKPSANPTRTTGYPAWLLPILIAAGLAGNTFPFSILNAHFVFGSIFAMLALQIFGWGRGVIAAAVISGYTYLAWNHPWAIVTMTAEAAAVGWAFHRRKLPLVAADALYWLFIGIPLGYLGLHLVSGLPASNTIFLMTKQGINGIANALLARLILSGFALRLNTGRISFREMVSNLLTLFVLCPALILLAVGGRTDLDESDRWIRTMLNQDSRELTEGLGSWLEDRKRAVVHLASMAQSVPPEQMQGHLDQIHATDINFLRMALLDKEATVVAYSPPVDELGRSNIGKSFADRPYLPVLKQTLQPMLTEVVVSRFGRPEPVAIMLAPVLPRGEYGGYVAGILNFDRIGAILESTSLGMDIRYTLLDRNGNVIMSNREDQQAMTPFARGQGTLTRLDEGVSQWVPDLPANTPSIELWGKSLYVAEASVGDLAEWRLILEQPVAPFQKRLYDRYSVNFFMLFAILVAALALAEFSSRRLVKAIESLGLFTRDLPARLASVARIDWPECAIIETSQLVVNFREMADSLADRFAEARRMKELLEQLVAERTRQLQTSESQLANALEIAHLGHWEYDVAKDLFTFNDQFYNIFGATAGEIGGYTMSSAEYARRFVHPDDQTLVGEETRKAIEATDPKFSRQLVHRMLYADGTTGHISVRYFIVKDASGRTVKTYGVNQDITERKRNEEALIEANRKLRSSQIATLNIMEDLRAENAVRKKNEAELERLKAAIEQAGEMVVITDPAGTIQYVNPAFEAVTGYTRDEVFGQTPRILKSGRQDEEFYRRLWETIASGRTWEGRMVNKRKDGALYTEVATISPVCDAEGWIVNYVAVKRDISEHLHLEAQLRQAQKMESVGRLAGGVAHDYNNMLGVILGYTELALDKVDPSDPLHADLEEIRKAGRRSAEITRQLLAFARKQTISPEVLDLNGTVDSMLKMLRRLIGEDIDLAWMPRAGLWPVKMDPAQIDQILVNLCVNARDAIGGVGRITIETDRVTFNGNYCVDHAEFLPGEFVLLAVSDNGCGMDKETQEHLFEPFFTTKELGKGTGLGLATVYGIVKQNDGFINVYSEPGQGTTFKIYLPRHGDRIDEIPVESLEEFPLGRGETLLLVEDEPAMLKMGKMMLERLGYEVLTAVGGSAALRLAEEHAGKIDLLMTDVVMPEMNGRDLAERLQGHYPKVKRLFMSGYTADVIAHRGVLPEGEHFIQKPFSLEELARKVREALDEKKMMNAE